MMKLKLLVVTLAALALSFGLAQAQDDYSLTLDHVDGLYNENPSELETDVPITFHIRFTNPDSPNEANIKGSSNAFRVYSPDGAEWTPITWAPYYDMVNYEWVLPFENWDMVYNGAIKLNSFSITGSGADTIGFAGYSDPSSPPFSNGVAPGFSQIVYTITTQLNDNQHGKTLCLDSCFYPPENQWLWSSDTGVAGISVGDIYPEWSGPHCFTIIDPNAPPPTSMSLSTNPDPLAFEATYGEADPTAGTLTVTSSGDAIDFNISSKPDWVTITPSSGTTTEANLSVAVSNAVAGVGNHSGTIEVSSSTATNSPQTVEISFNVAAGKPTIDCPEVPVEVAGCVNQLICFPLSISGADDVTISVPSGAYWEDVEGGQVCYTATSASEDFIVSATNTSGMTNCTFSVNATLSDKPVIDCPAETIALNVDELEGICYELIITDATEISITPSAGVTDLNYEENQFCFDVKAEGTFTFNIDATNDCGTSECDVTFDIIQNKYFIVDPESITKTGNPCSRRD